MIFLEETAEVTPKQWQRLKDRLKQKQDLWPTPIVTPQELLEAYIEATKIEIMNGEEVNPVLLLERLLEQFQQLHIGGRNDTEL